MATPRRHYQIAVTLTAEGHHALVRRHPGRLPWCWCHHTVRATSTRVAQAKAIAAHQQTPACQEIDQEVRAVWAALSQPQEGT